MALEVQLVSPERTVYSGPGHMVVCRTIGSGDIAFMAGHTRFIGALATHAVRVHLESGDVEAFAVHGGFVEMSNDRVTILSDVAELANQIDIARATRRKEEAETRLAQSPDDEEAASALRRAEVRLEVAQPR